MLSTLRTAAFSLTLAAIVQLICSEEARVWDVAGSEQSATSMALASFLTLRRPDAGFQVPGTYRSTRGERISTGRELRMMDHSEMMSESLDTGIKEKMKRGRFASRRSTIIGTILAGALALFDGSGFSQRAHADDNLLFYSGKEFGRWGIPRLYPNQGMFPLRPPPYIFDQLRPELDTRTLKFQYEKVQRRSVEALNEKMEGKPKTTLVELMPTAKAEGINNEVGGVYNHYMFFRGVTALGSGSPEPIGSLGKALIRDFGSYNEFAARFAAEALRFFGSGWLWLCVDSRSRYGDLKIVSTPNEDNPLMDDTGLIPILGLDLWEHAYIARRKIKKAQYVWSWFRLVNWRRVNEYYIVASEGIPINFN